VPVPVGLPLGAQVVPVRQVAARSSSAQVFFAPLSPELSVQGKRALDALVRRAGKAGQRAVVVGFVQQTRTTSNDQSLSMLRAQNVAAYLKGRGLPGSYQVRGDGVAGPGNAARRVNVSVTYQPGC
jgi:outer membrane protein OmpA-like peptidoglycan-associated protein